MNKLNLLKYDILKDVKHCFTTRTGGVSKGAQHSLNLSFSRESSRENVCKNYQICADRLCVDFNKMIGVPQKHTSNVLVVDNENCESTISGVISEKFNKGYDALITNIPGMTLCTIHADCVPVLIYDPVNKAVAAIHSGWRGTAKKISLNTVQKMIDCFKSNPADLKVVIGPSISIDNFETDIDVIDAFSDSFNMSFSDMCEKGLAYSKGNKYHVSVSGFVYYTLLICGVDENNIFCDSRCTYKNEELFFSHRRDKGNTGAMSAMICL